MVYVFLADGFEIMEALAPVDVLRRAKIDVKTVGIDKKIINSSSGIEVTADITEDEFEFNEVEAIIIPGGPGTKDLEKSAFLQNVIDKAVQNNTRVCAICAAPSILGHKGLMKGKRVTCFPGYEDSLIGSTITENLVETDGNFITAKGAGASILFGLEIIKELRGADVAGEIKSKIQCK